MSIIWCGAELIDFEVLALNNGVDLPLFNTSGNVYRSGISRGSIKIQSNGSIASPVITPALTTFWLKFVYGMDTQPYFNYQPSMIKNGTNARLLVTSTGSSTIGLYKYDGTTSTKLIQGVTKFYSWNQFIHAVIDLHVIDYDDTVNGKAELYINGKLEGEFIGDLTLLGQTSLDQFHVVNTTNIYGFHVSEVIIADEDTRTMYLKTLYPIAPGDTNQWTNDYTYIDEGEYNDSDSVYIGTIEQDFLFSLNDFVSENFLVKLIKISYRGFNPSASNVGHQVGVKTNGAIYLNGTTIDIPLIPENSYVVYTENPETLSPFTISELNALQIAFRSKSL